MSSSGKAEAFLTAHWGNLILLNYAVPADVLVSYLPRGCELDLFGGSPYVSLVAFQFTRTKVFGMRWPGFTNFPEINLRFYVKHQGQRGVCFIREFVPSHLISWIARFLYNEPYKKAEMWERVLHEGPQIKAHYKMISAGSSFECEIVAKNEPYLPAEDSFEHFFKEHELGVGRDRRGNTLTYKVHHPYWRVFPVNEFFLKIDAASLYGSSFDFLANREPNSVVFAEGSEITVFKK